nr:hypothetical protein [Thermoactinospora rubra]
MSAALRQGPRRGEAEIEPGEQAQDGGPLRQPRGRRSGAGQAHDTVRADHHLVELPLADGEVLRFDARQQPAQQSAIRRRDLHEMRGVLSSTPFFNALLQRLSSTKRAACVKAGRGRRCRP